MKASHLKTEDYTISSVVFVIGKYLRKNCGMYKACLWGHGLQIPISVQGACSAPSP